MEFFTHDLKEDRPFKAVIRGLPLIEIEDIVDELKVNYNLEVTEVFRIKRKNEETMKCVCVCFTSSG